MAILPVTSTFEEMSLAPVAVANKRARHCCRIVQAANQIGEAHRMQIAAEGLRQTAWKSIEADGRQ